MKPAAPSTVCPADVRTSAFSIESFRLQRFQPKASLRCRDASVPGADSRSVGIRLFTSDELAGCRKGPKRSSAARLALISETLPRRHLQILVPGTRVAFQL